MGIEIFGIEFGSDSERKGKIVEEHEISLQEIMNALHIGGNPVFTSYDYKTKKLTIKCKVN